MTCASFRSFPVLVLLALAACSPNVPRLQMPLTVHADCENRAVKQTAIESIVASTDDEVRGQPYPGDPVLSKTIHAVGGAFAYWPSQQLHMPNTAKALGLDGDYVTMTRVVVTNQVENGSRPIWLTITTPHGPKIVLERAYDIQNVCIEGARDL
ncbi:MAG: hypothetical protein ABR975_04635 [Vulcanimicrobiaceae bacterium]